MRAPTQAEMRRSDARRRIGELIERLKLLKLMIEIDPQAAMRLSTQIAKELKAALKDYRNAGGFGPDGGVTASAQLGLAAAQATQGSAPAAVESPEAARAYERAEGLATDPVREREQAAFEAEFTEKEATLRDVRGIVGALKEARQKIALQFMKPLNRPTQADAEAWDEAMKAVESEADDFSLEVDALRLRVTLKV